MSLKAHIYDPQTGMFTGQSFMTATHDPVAAKYALAVNTPAGHAAHVAEYVDHLSQRMDLTTGEVVDYQPPQPTPDYEWNSETKRWQLTAVEQTRLTSRADALARIAMLEASGIRAGREAQLGVAGALKRLAIIDDQIAALRGAL